MLVVDLPTEVLLKVCQRLDSKSLFNLSVTNLRLSNVASHDTLWQSLCEIEKGIKYNCQQTWKQLFRMDLSNICKHLHIDIQSLHSKKIIFNQPKCIMLDIDDCNTFFNDLWICLMDNCTNIGCGRKKGMHSQNHYKASHHSLVLKASTMEIW
jgi:hypothetical protein